MKVLTKEEIESFRAAAAPLVDWLRQNTHPHCCATVDAASAELFESQAVVTWEPTP
jgi:hypothetical protein